MNKGIIYCKRERGRERFINMYMYMYIDDHLGYKVVFQENDIGADCLNLQGRPHYPYNLDHPTYFYEVIVKSLDRY